MDWRLIINRQGAAADNMAADEALLLSQANSSAPPALRLYGWRPAAISLGYFQKADKEIDFTACAQRGIDVVRRLTGGRAVLHDAELSYSITISEDHPLVPPTITAAYLLFSKALLAALRELGIDAHMTMPQAAYSQSRSRAMSAACFDAPSYYEITVQGRKLVGSAQVRKNGLLLQHGSILLDFSADTLASVLRTRSIEDRERMSNMLTKRATSLSEQLGRKITWEQVAAVIEQAFAATLDINFTTDELSAHEKALAKELAATKYSQDSWNRMR